MTRRPAPCWFLVLVVVAGAGLARVCDVGLGAPEGPALALWGFLILAGQAIWAGVQVATTITLQVLNWIVIALRVSLKYAWMAVKEIGTGLWTGAKQLWEFTRRLYEGVLLPGWQKFWQLVDRVKSTLEAFFKPVFDFLTFLRSELLGFYTKWIRPILDSIDIARKALRVFSSLGLEWARELDRKLGELQEKIDAPFRFALAKLNEIINVVNRVVTADGLFQRLALVRSIERDIRYVSRAFMNWRSKTLTDDDYKRRRDSSQVRPLDEVKRDIEEMMRTGDGRYAPLAREMAKQWAIYLGV